MGGNRRAPDRPVFDVADRTAHVPVITGIGLVSCAGTGTNAHRAALADPRRAVASRVRDNHARVTEPLYALAVDDGRPHTTTASRLANLAVAEAVADAHLTDRRTGEITVILASSVGDARATELARTSAHPLPHGDFALVDSVRRQRDLRGSDRYELSNACSGSGYAISLGCDLIEAGQADVVVAGGAEAYSRVTVAAFNAMSALSPTGISRPFDKDRDGVVLGEGAAAVVLESAAHARRRGITSYATVAGSAWSCDAHHPMAPDPAGTQAVRAMRAALDRARTLPHDVACVIPHGTGTPLNDAVESASLREVFGMPRADVAAIYSLKAVIGHLAGGSAAASVAVAAMGLRDGRLPGNLAVGAPDPDCAVHIPNEPIDLRGRSVMVNAYAAGGSNISLVLREAG